MDFRTWLIEQYHEQATAYRAALDREIRHTVVIYGYPLPKDVRNKLLASFKEIPVPLLPKYQGEDRRESHIIKIYNSTPKPNWHLILRTTFEEAKI